jgi:hypothetical protein
MPGDRALRYGFQGPDGIRTRQAARRNKLEDTDLDESWLQTTNGSSAAIDPIAGSRQEAANRLRLGCERVVAGDNA